MNKTNSKGMAIAGVAGAIIGAGVAVAASKVLSDEKTRKKIGQGVSNLKDQLGEAVQTARSGMDTLKARVAEKAEEVKEVGEKAQG